MREAFRGWYKPTDDDLQLLWEKGTIVLDANVLLAPYRVAGRTRNRLFDLVEAYQEQIWVPYQAGLEYQRNRLNVVAAQRATYFKIRSELDSAEKTLLNRRPDHPVLDPAGFEGVVQRALGGVARYVDGAESGHPDVLGDDRDDDLVRDRWDALLEDRISERLVVDEKWVKEADKRYELEVPPGFEDKKRNKGARLYGDLILWCELLKHVADRGVELNDVVPVIFVTDDAKEDWWRIADGQRLGPRPELVEEIGTKGGKPFWMYSLSRFIRVASEQRGWELPPEMIDKPESTATEDEARLERVGLEGSEPDESALPESEGKQAQDSAQVESP